jgi:hypothetical protein
MIAKDYNTRLNRQNGAHSTLCWHLRQFSCTYQRRLSGYFYAIGREYLIYATGVELVF